MKRKIILIIVLLLLTQTVLGLGIRPAKTIVAYDENAVHTGVLTIVNTDAQDLHLTISVEGPLEGYISFEENDMIIPKNKEQKNINYQVELPHDIAPGESTSYIVLEQKLDNNGEFIDSKISIRHKVIAYGPYPDKFIKAKLNFQLVGNAIELISEVENFGKKDIDNIQTRFFINDKEQKLNVLESGATTLKVKENKLLRSQIDRSLLEQGEFAVKAITTYDDQDIELVKKLLVGKPEVNIKYFDKYFVAEKVNEYTMDLENKWNRKVENVYVDVEIKKENEKVGEFRTRSIDIGPFLVETINDFLDARENEKGKYTFNMIVNFWNSYKMDQKTFNVEMISQNDFEALPQDKQPIVGEVIKETRQPRNLAVPLIFFNLVVLIVAIYVIYRYKNKNNYQGGDEAF